MSSNLGYQNKFLDPIINLNTRKKQKVVHVVLSRISKQTPQSDYKLIHRNGACRLVPDIITNASEKSRGWCMSSSPNTKTNASVRL